MAKNKPTPSVTPPPTQLEPLAPHDELPIVESLAFQKTKQGWVVVLITSQGLKVLDNELLSKPLPRLQALDKLKIYFAQRFLIPESPKQ